jgi:hypothetical protein
MENSNMVSKVDFKNIFQSSLKDMLTKKENRLFHVGRNNLTDISCLDKNYYNNYI